MPAWIAILLGLLGVGISLFLGAFIYGLGKRDEALAELARIKRKKE